jgi:hypothetical protein
MPQSRHWLALISQIDTDFKDMSLGFEICVNLCNLRIRLFSLCVFV